jgi:hypothetical protein
MEPSGTAVPSMKKRTLMGPRRISSMGGVGMRGFYRIADCAARQVGDPG